MKRPTLRELRDTLALIERRARGLEPGDGALARLRPDRFPADPLLWLKTTAAKVAVVALIAALMAGLFAGGLAVMKAMGIGH